MWSILKSYYSRPNTFTHLSSVFIKVFQNLLGNSFYTPPSQFKGAWVEFIGTFRSEYEYEYEYEFFNVYQVRMPNCVRLSCQLLLSSKSRCCLDANYEIFNKSCPRLQVHYRCKGELKG